MGGGVGAASGTNAINDGSQIVGSYTDSLTHGVLIDRKYTASELCWVIFKAIP